MPRRSSCWLEGRQERAAARGMLRAVGMGDDDFAKPQIGVASSWNEITPCNLSLDRLAKAVKNGVHAAGGYPLEFGTISVSDGISMGHEGMHFSLVSREVIADSVETVMMAERLDGSVLLAGCDKRLPGMLTTTWRQRHKDIDWSKRRDEENKHLDNFLMDFENNCLEDFGKEYPGEEFPK